MGALTPEDAANVLLDAIEDDDSGCDRWFETLTLDDAQATDLVSLVSAALLQRTDAVDNFTRLRTYLAGLACLVMAVVVGAVETLRPAHNWVAVGFMVAFLALGVFGFWKGRE